jgi:hypothetical protein
MAGRFHVSLVHQGCSHTGAVVWVEREKAGQLLPVIVSLPRGFVSADRDNGSIVIMCTGCAQTVASASSVTERGPEASPDAGLAEVVEEPAGAAPSEPVTGQEAATSGLTDEPARPLLNRLRQLAHWMDPRKGTEP